MFSLVSRLKYGTLCCSIASLFREEALCIFACLIKDFFFFLDVDHFKSPYWISHNIASVLCFLVFWLQGTWDLSFPTSDRTCTPRTGKQSLHLDHQGSLEALCFNASSCLGIDSFVCMFILYLRRLCLTLLTWVAVFFLWEDFCDLLAMFVLVSIVSWTYLRTALTQCPGIVS